MALVQQESLQEAAAEIIHLKGSGCRKWVLRSLLVNKQRKVKFMFVEITKDQCLFEEFGEFKKLEHSVRVNIAQVYKVWFAKVSIDEGLDRSLSGSKELGTITFQYRPLSRSADDFDQAAVTEIYAFMSDESYSSVQKAVDAYTGSINE